jgi:hypothetical protein
MLYDLVGKYEEERQKNEASKAQAQRNLNYRLDGLYFRVMSKEDFDAEESHYDEQITFVITTENGAITSIDLYKGDIRISMGGGGGGTIENTLIVGNLE